MAKRRRRFFKRGEMILVEWVDSAAAAGWSHQDPSEAPEVELYRCRSAGFVFHDDDEGTTLAMGLSDVDDGVWGRFTIPAVSITKRRRLQVL